MKSVNSVKILKTGAFAVSLMIAFSTLSACTTTNPNNEDTNLDTTTSPDGTTGRAGSELETTGRTDTGTTNSTTDKTDMGAPASPSNP